MLKRDPQSHASPSLSPHTQSAGSPVGSTSECTQNPPMSPCHHPSLGPQHLSPGNCHSLLRGSPGPPPCLYMSTNTAAQVGVRARDPFAQNILGPIVLGKTLQSSPGPWPRPPSPAFPPPASSTSSSHAGCVLPPAFGCPLLLEHCPGYLPCPRPSIRVSPRVIFSVRPSPAAYFKWAPSLFYFPP